MDSIIQETNFIHDDSKLSQEFGTRLKAWNDTSKETITSGQITCYFQTLGKKLKEAKCPKFKTEGWKQALHAFHVLVELAGSQIVTGTIHPDEFHEVLYKMMIDWFKEGPCTLALEFTIYLLKDRHLGVKDYTTSQKDEGLNKLLRAVTSTVTKKEDIPNKDFYSAYRTYLDKFLTLAFDKSQLMMEDSTKLMMDFVFSLYLDYTHLEDDSINHLEKAAKAILRTYSDKWKTFSDIPRFKSYIQKFSALAKTPGFPRSKFIADLVYRSLTTITKQLQQTGQVETFSDDLFDLMEVMSVAQGDGEHVVRAFSAAVVFFDQRNRNKNNQTIFTKVAPRFMTLVALLDVAFLKDTRFVSDIMTMLENSYADNNNLTAQWLSLSLPLMRRRTLKTINASRNVLSKYDKIKWKEHEQFVDELLDVIKEVVVPSDDSRESQLKEFTTCVSYLLRGLKRGRVLKRYGKTLMYLSVHLVELRAEELFGAAEDVGEHIEIDVKGNKEAVMEVMSRLHVILKDESIPWVTSWHLQRAVSDIVQSIFKCVPDGKIFSDEDLEVFTSMCVTCLEKEPINPDSGNMSYHFVISIKLMASVVEWLGAVKKVGMAKELVPLLLQILRDEDDNNVQTCVGRYLTDLSTQDSNILAPAFDDLLAIYLDKEIWNLLMPVGKIYSSTDVSMKSHFQPLLAQLFDTSDKLVKGHLPTVLWTAAKKEAELFTSDNMKDLIEFAKSDNSLQVMVVHVVSDVSKRRPGNIVPHLDLLMKNKEWNPVMLPMLNDILSTVAMYDKNVSEKIVDHLIAMSKAESDKSLLVTALNAVRLIGFKYPDVLKPKRQRIEALQLIDSDAQGQRQHILDMIDGKTPDEVKKQLELQQNAVGELVEKVEDVEGTIANVVGDLVEQRDDLDNVKNDVIEQAQKLEKVEEVVDDTVKKVEEIDGKTLSHAPYWSRDISKLLNPTTEHDWRLLSSRLGYSNADIRGWAQQSDPCMAMLNEWYATRKTSEATLAILTHLQEMNCDEAALIVENAMKKAEAVVEDDEFEYASPPEIFISYQWGHQEEVKLLHRHLTMAGYDCWMDIGQMGGGDKLFEKIDNGMRAAKLVISCVTAKYAKSPNCNREVNLAVGVKKPIIPLLLENCSWPPPGSMGPIFSESLYIRFFQTGQEETKDDRYWAEDKFQELLMQLSVNGLSPDEGKIDKVYRNWWMPLEEEINIDKSKTRDGGKAVAVPQNNENTEQEESPDVFISYQWDKQKNIIKLYQRLTSLGFSCWLDIKQMGGGDSLYDKIDRGVRNSKVVLSCVTKKYAMSANCRREVSLTDALKKPLLPLLLEEMTWPPSGPMSMVMTQLLYIGFQQESLQTSWECSQFGQLVEKLASYVKEDSAPNQDTEPNQGKRQSGPSQDKDLGKNIQQSPEEETKPQEDLSHSPASEDNNKSRAEEDAQPSHARNEESEGTLSVQTPTSSALSVENSQVPTANSNKMHSLSFNDEFKPANDSNSQSPGTLITIDDNDTASRPYSALPVAKRRYPNSSKGPILPPPEMRLQTSRSCCLL